MKLFLTGLLSAFLITNKQTRTASTRALWPCCSALGPPWAPMMVPCGPVLVPAQCASSGPNPNKSSLSFAECPDESTNCSSRSIGRRFSLIHTWHSRRMNPSCQDSASKQTAFPALSNDNNVVTHLTSIRGSNLVAKSPGQFCFRKSPKNGHLKTKVADFVCFRA